MHLNKRAILPLAILAILGIVLFAAWSQTKGKADANPSAPVAMVNGAPIALATLEREMRKTRDGYAMQGLFPDDDQLDALRQETLQRLIETELLWQQSVKQEIVVTEEAVAAELEEMKRQHVNEAIFEGVLKSANITMAELLPLIRKDLTIRAFVEQEIAATITVSADESESFYQNNPQHFEEPEQIRASQICILLEPEASAAEKHKAHEAIEILQQRLAQGESFAALAEEASHCGGIDSSGDLGFFTR
ncbi:MAG: SurA N-terminal domain-containing protein, partial [Desulfatitalea sp.]|nr:SurA N-terminal domain-containing protein [Desulfatitalea sp.]